MSSSRGLSRTQSRGFISLGLILLLVIILAAFGGAGWYATRHTSTTYGDFGAPELVTIEGYTGTVQDPWIMSDDQYIIWESRTDVPGAVSDVYYAKKIDYKTFSLVGKVQGLPSSGVAAAKTDTAGNIYFLSSLYSAQGITIGHGTFADGAVTNMAPTIGISKSWNSNMSAAPSRDGKYLVFEDISNVATLAIAKKNADGTFTRLANSADIMKNITDQFSVAYAPSLSNDNLELFFTAPPSTNKHSMIYVARRTSITEPFGVAEAINTFEDGLSEAPSLSLDGKHLYFHKV